MPRPRFFVAGANEGACRRCGKHLDNGEVVAAVKSGTKTFVAHANCLAESWQTDLEALDRARSYKAVAKVLQAASETPTHAGVVPSAVRAVETIDQAFRLDTPGVGERVAMFLTSFNSLRLENQRLSQAIAIAGETISSLARQQAGTRRSLPRVM